MRFQAELARPQRAIVQVGIGLSSAAGVLLCALLLGDREESRPLQIILQAGLMVAGVMTHTACVGVFFLVSLFQTCAREPQHPPLHAAKDDEEEEEHMSSYPYYYDDRDEEEEVVHTAVVAEDNGYTVIPLLPPPPAAEPNSLSSSQTTTTFALVGMPREVIIHSMYVGGTGTYLAIEPLCMWNCSSTLAFLASLLCISVWDHQLILRNKTQKARYSSQKSALAGLLGLTLLLSAAVQHQQQAHASSSPRTTNSNNATTETTGLTTMMTHPITLSPLPSLLLAAVSPFLLRISGGGMHLGHLFHTMTPAQTIETGMPIGLLWGALVLCWLNSFDASLFPVVVGLFEPARLWAVLLLAPPALAGTIGFLFYTLRKRTSLISVAVLLLVLVVRQSSSLCVAGTTTTTTTFVAPQDHHYWALSLLPLCEKRSSFVLVAATLAGAVASAATAAWLAYRSGLEV